MTSFYYFTCLPRREHIKESVAFVIFNVKGKDLMAIHSPNDFKDDSDGEKERVYQEYKDLGLSTERLRRLSILFLIPVIRLQSKVHICLKRI